MNRIGCLLPASSRISQPPWPGEPCFYPHDDREGAGSTHTAFFLSTDKRALSARAALLFAPSQVRQPERHPPDRFAQLPRRKRDESERDTGARLAGEESRARVEPYAAPQRTLDPALHVDGRI